jgi:hypothetical protein
MMGRDLEPGKTGSACRGGHEDMVCFIPASLVQPNHGLL